MRYFRQVKNNRNYPWINLEKSLQHQISALFDFRVRIVGQFFSEKANERVVGVNGKRYKQMTEDFVDSTSNRHGLSLFSTRWSHKWKKKC